MTPDQFPGPGVSNPPSPIFARVGGVLTSLALLGWRIASPGPGLWRDWVAVLALYWLYSAFASRSGKWVQVTLSVMAYLLSIYVLGQVPHVVAAWGQAP